MYLIHLLKIRSIVSGFFMLDFLHSPYARTDAGILITLQVISRFQIVMIKIQEKIKVI